MRDGPLGGPGAVGAGAAPRGGADRPRGPGPPEDVGRPRGDRRDGGRAGARRAVSWAPSLPAAAASRRERLRRERTAAQLRRQARLEAEVAEQLEPLLGPAGRPVGDAAMALWRRRRVEGLPGAAALAAGLADLGLVGLGSARAPRAGRGRPLDRGLPAPADARAGQPRGVTGRRRRPRRRRPGRRPRAPSPARAVRRAAAAGGRPALARLAPRRPGAAPGRRRRRGRRGDGRRPGGAGPRRPPGAARGAGDPGPPGRRRRR